MAAAGVQINYMAMSGSGAIPVPVWNSERNEIVFATTGLDTKFQYDLNISFFVAFGDVDEIGGEPAIPLLNAIASEVNRIVLAVEAEAKRIGLCT